MRGTSFAGHPHAGGVRGERPKLVEHVDAPEQAEWKRFLDSGMPQLISSYNLVQALHGFVDSGMARRFERGAISTEEAVDDLAPELARAMLRFLEIRGFLTSTPEPDQRWSLTPHGQDMVSQLAYAQFGFYREAYGPVLEKVSSLLRGEIAYPKDVHRDGEALGRHCTDGFLHFGTSAALRALAKLEARSFLDLGCGGGGFLISACEHDPALRGYGLDISPEAIAFARTQVTNAGLAERIELHVGDAFAPGSWPEACRRAEAILTVGTMHEEYRRGEDSVIALLDRYAGLMKEGPMRGLVLGEPEVYLRPEDADFFFVHVLTQQGMPRTRDGWLRVFERSQLRCEEMIVPVELGPRFVYYVLRPRS